MIKNVKGSLKNGFFHGLLMCVLAMTVFFLCRTFTRETTLYIVVAAIILTVVGALVFRLCKNTKKKALSVLALIVVVAVDLTALFAVTVRQMAGNMLFYPHQDAESYEYLNKAEAVEELSIPSENGNISGWFYHQAGDNAPLLLYFGGNGECSASWMKRVLERGNDTPYEGYNLAAVDYPGYGFSDGSCSESSIKTMVLAAFDAIVDRDDVDADRIVVMGYSLGTGAANYAASQRDVIGLILEAPYSNGYDLYNSQMPIFYGPMRLLVTYKMPADAFAASVDVVPLLFATKDDELVPYESSHKLSAIYPQGCHFISLSGFGHNDFGSQTQVMDEIGKYLAEVKE